MRKQKSVRMGMRWMNFSGLGEGDTDRRWLLRDLLLLLSSSSSSNSTWRFGSWGVSVRMSSLAPPWMWSLEDGEPRDCLCIVANRSNRAAEEEG